MNPERTYAQVVTVFKDSHFKKMYPKNYANLTKNLQVLYDNLWGMFDRKKINTLSKLYKLTSENVGPYDERPFGLSVADYAWTKEVSDKFYNHPNHKLFMKWITNRHPGNLGMWRLNHEPSDYVNTNKGEEAK